MPDKSQTTQHNHYYSSVSQRDDCLWYFIGRDGQTHGPFPTEYKAIKAERAQWEKPPETTDQNNKENPYSTPEDRVMWAILTSVPDGVVGIHHARIYASAAIAEIDRIRANK